MIEYKVKVYDDRTVWYNLNDQLHREDGPACEWTDGYKAWWVNGKLHRIDGPAVERADGTKRWYIDGVEYTEEEFRAKIQSTQSKKPLANKTIEIDGVEYILT